MAETGIAGAEIAGLRVTGFLDLESAASYILDRAGSVGGFGVAINAEKVITYRHDRALRERLARATLRYPDGAGAMLALRKKGIQTTRIAGADLWLAVLDLAARRHHVLRVALIGGTPEVMNETYRKLGEIYPLHEIVLARNGYDGVSDTAELDHELGRLRPHVVFVAMGSPKQELLITEFHKHCPSAFYLGLGGSFDVFVGKVRRAPVFMQRLHLEWLFRLLDDPRRIKRQIKYVEFVILMWMGKL